VSALFATQIPALRRWASGRLPRWARDIADTTDLIQDAVLQTFRRLDRIDLRGRRALQGYLREAVQNRIFDELRRFSRRPPSDPLDERSPTLAPSPLTEAIDAENRQRYLAALRRMTDDQRELVVGRIELGYSYEQLALLSGRATPDAARVALRRALLRLAEEMASERPATS
jgi:RNA polymerase sigma-70 factor (ECF subfamily)